MASRRRPPNAKRTSAIKVSVFGKEEFKERTKRPKAAPKNMDGMGVRIQKKTPCQVKQPEISENKNEGNPKI